VPGVVGSAGVQVRFTTPVPTYVHAMYELFGAVVAASASQSPPPPGPFVSVAVTGVPPVTLVALTAMEGPPDGAVTVTVGLVATRVLFTNSRNSYVPVSDAAIVQVRVVTPAPTFTDWR
jgi:hypothetical protein